MDEYIVNKGTLNNAMNCVDRCYTNVCENKLKRRAKQPNSLIDAMSYMLMAMDNYAGCDARSVRNRHVIAYHVKNCNAIMMKDKITMEAVQHGMDCLDMWYHDAD